MSQLSEQAVKDLRVLGGEELVKFVLEARQAKIEETEETFERANTRWVMCSHCGKKRDKDVLTCQGCSSQSLVSEKPKAKETVGTVRSNFVMRPGISAREFYSKITGARIWGHR